MIISKCFLFIDEGVSGREWWRLLVLSENASKNNLLWKVSSNRHRCKHPLVISLNLKVSFTQCSVDMSNCVKNPKKSFIIFTKFPFSPPALIDAEFCVADFFIRSSCHDILILSFFSLQIKAVVEMWVEFLNIIGEFEWECQADATSVINPTKSISAQTKTMPMAIRETWKFLHFFVFFFNHKQIRRNKLLTLF